MEGSDRRELRLTMQKEASLCDNDSERQALYGRYSAPRGFKSRLPIRVTAYRYQDHHAHWHSPHGGL